MENPQQHQQRKVRTVRQRKAPPAPEPMHALDSIPIVQLVPVTEAAIAADCTPNYGAPQISRLRKFVARCEAAGVTQLPDDRLATVAKAYVESHTGRKGSPSPSEKDQRRAVIRRLLKAAVRAGVVVLDPFDLPFDAVLAGEDLPIAVKVKAFRANGRDAEAFERVRSVFESIVTRAVTADPGIPIPRLSNFLCDLLIWCDGESIPLEADRVLSYRVVDRHLSERYDAKGGSYSSARSTLFRAEQAISPSPPRRAARRASRNPGYTEAEQAAMIRWARSLTGLARNFWVLLVLGLGAGFDMPGMRNLRGTHIFRVGDFVVAHDPAQREFPVCFEPEWAEEAMLLAEAAGDNYLLCPNRRDRTNRAFLSGVRQAAGPPPAGTPRPSCPRLKTTWMARHLDRGTDAMVLVRAAGLKGFGSIDHFFKLIEWPGDDEAFRRLRGDR